jgi:hypothetical protein
VERREAKESINASVWVFPYAVSGRVIKAVHNNHAS